MTANVELAEWISDLNERKASASHGEIWAKVKEYRATVAHELAEQIRANCHLKPGECGCHTAADLIDPEVSP